MTADGWWAETRGPDLAQGDLVAGLAVPRVATPVDAAVDHVDVETVTLDVIVLTQTCDLEHGKQPDVLVGRVVSWESFVAAQLQGGNEAVRSSQFAKNLRNGAVPPLHLLRYHEGAPQLSWSLVVFRELQTVPRDMLTRHVEQQPQRLRLRSPYREHLGQAFARFFMRVGLPLDVDDFERDGPAIAKAATAGA